MPKRAKVKRNEFIFAVIAAWLKLCDWILFFELVSAVQ